MAQIDGINPTFCCLRNEMQQGMTGAGRIGDKEDVRDRHYAVAVPTTPLSGLLADA